MSVLKNTIKHHKKYLGGGGAGMVGRGKGPFLVSSYKAQDPKSCWGWWEPLGGRVGTDRALMGDLVNLDQGSVSPLLPSAHPALSRSFCLGMFLHLEHEGVRLDL